MTLYLSKYIRYVHIFTDNYSYICRIGIKCYFALMMIETSNFSLYNVIAMIEIVISATVVCLLIPLA